MEAKLKRTIGMVLVLIPYSVLAEFSAILEHEWVIDMSAHGQKFETLFEPEWNISLTPDVAMTLIARARFDNLAKLGPSDKKSANYGVLNGPVYAGGNGEVSIREWYLDTEFMVFFCVLVNSKLFGVKQMA